MRICQCKRKIPRRVKINGTYRSLQHRKFCLKCSPFGAHNTRKNPLVKSSRPTVNGKRSPYSKWSEEAKEDMRARLWWKGRNRKVKLLKMKGDKCEHCGYNKTFRVLTFHHKDPSKKNFGLDSRTIMTRKWDELVEEVNKCRLLCLNCHMEIEGLTESKYIRFADKYAHLI